VEVRFVITKIASTFLVFLVPYISNVACSTIIFSLSCFTFHAHLSIMPFNIFKTNAVRGGVYGAVTWTCFSTVVVGIFTHTTLAESSGVQALQWLLVACIPLAYFCGYFVTCKRRDAVLKQIERLRGDWQTREDERAKIKGPKGQHMITDGSEPDFVANDKLQGRKYSTYEKFFNPRWEQQRAFLRYVRVQRSVGLFCLCVRSLLPHGWASFDTCAYRSGPHAMTVAREILRHRTEADLPFLKYVMARATVEVPDSECLLIFRLAVLR